jgi:hypothetical protein
MIWLGRKSSSRGQDRSPDLLDKPKSIGLSTMLKEQFPRSQ